jgi:hypothetical protein
MLQTAAHLEKTGLPAPARLFAPSWGAPQRGLHGRLNFVDLDEVVPAGEVWPGWQDCLDATFHLLEGDHWEFLRCPPSLLDLIEQEMTRH